MALYQNSLNVLHILNGMRQKSYSFGEINDLVNLLEDPFFQKILTINDSIQNLKFYTENYSIPNLSPNDFAISLNEGLILSPQVADYVEFNQADPSKVQDGTQANQTGVKTTAINGSRGHVKEDGTHHYTVSRTAIPQQPALQTRRVSHESSFGETNGSGAGSFVGNGTTLGEKVAGEEPSTATSLDTTTSPQRTTEITIRLFRPENRSLGVSILGLQNELNDSVGVFVKDIDPEGIAGRNGQLEEGDQIVAINGVRLNQVSHHEAISLLQNAKGPLNLVVERKSHPKSPGSSHPLRSSSDLHLPEPLRTPDSGDATLTGDGPANRKRFVYSEEGITEGAKGPHPHPQGLPPTSSIHSNDAASSIDQKSPPSYNVQDSSSDVDRVPRVSRGSLGLEPFTDTGGTVDLPAPGMVLDTEFTEMEKIDLTNDGTGLGFGIAGGRSTGVVVKSHVPGSVSYVDGRLRIGDHVLQIDHVNLRGMSSEQVASVLRHCGPFVEFVVAREVMERPPPNLDPNIIILPTKLLNEQLGLDVPPIQILRSVLPTEPELTTEESFESAEENESFDRILIKGPYGLGMTIAGYIGDEISGIFVKSIAEGSPAHMDGWIRVNDQIIEVDGKSLEGLTNQEAVEVLKNTGNEVNLVFVRYLRGSKHDQLENHIEHDESIPKSASSERILAQMLKKEGEEMNQFFNDRKDLSRSAPHIPNGNVNGAALNENYVDSKVTTDRVTADQLQPITIEEIVEEDEGMRDLKRRWKGILAPDVQLVTAEFDKFREGGGLGISLEGTVDMEDGREMHPHHYIRSILTDGPLGLNGKLMSGDELLEVNGQILYGKNHREVVRVLKELPIRVKIVCARRSQRPYDIRNREMEPGALKIDLSNKPSSSALLFGDDRPFTPENKILGSGGKANAPHPPPGFEQPDAGDRLFKAKSEGSISMANNFENSFPHFRSRSLEPLTGLAMWSTEPLVIELIKGDKGLGFSILDYQDPLNPEHTVIVIRSLVPGGQAQLDGRILPGDRLLFVNDKNLEEVSLDTAVQALKSVPRGIVKIGIAKPVPLEEGLIENLFVDTSKETDEPLTDLASTRNESSLEIPLDESGRDSADTPSERPFKTGLTINGTPTPLAIEEDSLISGQDELDFEVSPTPKYTYKTEINLQPSSTTAEDTLASHTVGDKNGKDERVQGTQPVFKGYREELIPLPHALERTMKIKKGLLPLGATLETEGSGANGCIVSSINSDGAVRQDGRLKVGDYVTSLNNESLRYITSAQAKMILNRISLLSTDISINYIPSDDAAIHNQSVILALESQAHSGSQIPRASLVPTLSAHQLEIYIKYVDTLMNRLIKDISDVLRRMKREEIMARRRKSSTKSRKSLESQSPTVISPTTEDDILLPKKNSLIPTTLEQMIEGDGRRTSLQPESIDGISTTTSPPPRPDNNMTTEDRQTSSESLEIQEIFGSKGGGTDADGIYLGGTSLEDEKRTIIPEDNRWSPPRFVELIKEENQSYGLSIVGGTIESDLNPDFDTPVAGIFIKNVFPNGPASQNGLLRTGDRILEINDYRVYNSSLDEAVKIIRESKNSVKFLVQSLMGSNLIPYTFTFTPKKSELVSTSVLSPQTKRSSSITDDGGKKSQVTSPGTDLGSAMISTPASILESRDSSKVQNFAKDSEASTKNMDDDKDVVSIASTPPAHKKQSITSAIVTDSPNDDDDGHRMSSSTNMYHTNGPRKESSHPNQQTHLPSTNPPATFAIDGTDISEIKDAVVPPNLYPSTSSTVENNVGGIDAQPTENMAGQGSELSSSYHSPQISIPSFVSSGQTSFLGTQSPAQPSRDTVLKDALTIKRTVPVSAVIPSPSRPSVVKFSDADIIVHHQHGTGVSGIETSFKPITTSTPSSTTTTSRLPTPVKVNYKSIDQLKKEFFSEGTASDSASIDENSISTPSSSPAVSPSKSTPFLHATNVATDRHKVPKDSRKTDVGTGDQGGDVENPFRRTSILNMDLTDFRKAIVVHPPRFPYKPVSLRPLSMASENAQEVLLDLSSGHLSNMASDRRALPIKSSLSYPHRPPRLYRFSQKTGESSERSSMTRDMKDVQHQISREPQNSTFRPIDLTGVMPPADITASPLRKSITSLKMEPVVPVVPTTATNDTSSTVPNVAAESSPRRDNTVTSSPEFSSSSSSNTGKMAKELDDINYQLKQLELSNKPDEFRKGSLPSFHPQNTIRTKRDLRSKSLIPTPIQTWNTPRVQSEDVIKKETIVDGSGTKTTYIIDDKTKHGISIKTESPTKSTEASTQSSEGEDQSPKKDKIKGRYGDLPGEIHIVELYKTKSGKLGISLAGNKDRNKLSVFVVGISSDEAEKKIMVGDEILEANNHVLFGRSHLNASSILKNLPSSKIKLIILRRENGLEEMAVKPLKPNALPTNDELTLEPPEPPTDKPKKVSLSSPSKKMTPIPPRLIQDTFDLLTCPIVPDTPTLIHIEKHGRPLGLSFTGGQDTLLGYVVIEEVHKDGAADKDGRLKVNDIILEVNGENLRKTSLDFAKEYIYQPQTHLTLLINRYSDVEMFEKSYCETQAVELIKKPGKALGISIKGRSVGPKVIISHVLKSSPADVDGRLRVGDQIIEINSEDVTQSDQGDVALTLKGLIGKISLRVRRLKQASNDSIVGPKVPLTDKFLKLKLSSDSLQEMVSHHGKFVLSGKSSSPTNKKVGNITLVQINRLNNEDLGLKLSGTGISGQTQVMEPISVAEIQSNSLAEGKLQPGDRILSINGQSLENMSINQANNLMKTLSGTISFEVAKPKEPL